METPATGGRLAERLEAWPRRKIRCVLWVFVLVLCGVDCAFPAIEVAPIYLLLTCAAAWRLDERESFAFAALATFTSLAPILIGRGPAWALHLFAQAFLRISCALLLAAIVASFRRSYERERFMARHDVMTGAMNRAAFKQQARRMLAAAARGRRPMLLAVVDLDDFKAINDEHGHAAGDSVIRAFASGATNVLRRRDIFGRLGGDEFAVLMTIDSLDRAQQLAARLHQRLSTVLNDLPHPATISTGALIVPSAGGLGLDILLHQADGLMYDGKRREKGRLVIGVAGPEARALAFD